MRLITNLSVWLITRHGNGLTDVPWNHKCGSFTTLTWHVTSTAMLIVQTSILSLRWRAGIVAAPACVHRFIQAFISVQREGEIKSNEASVLLWFLSRWLSNFNDILLTKIIRIKSRFWTLVCDYYHNLMKIFFVQIRDFTIVNDYIEEIKLLYC